MYNIIFITFSILYIFFLQNLDYTFSSNKKKTDAVEIANKDEFPDDPDMLKLQEEINLIFNFAFDYHNPSNEILYYSDLTSRQKEFINSDILKYLDQLKLLLEKENVEDISSTFAHKFVFYMKHFAAIKIAISNDLSISEWENDYEPQFRKINDIISSLLYKDNKDLKKAFKEKLSKLVYDNFMSSLEILSNFANLPGVPLLKNELQK